MWMELGLSQRKANEGIATQNKDEEK